MLGSKSLLRPILPLTVAALAILGDRPASAQGMMSSAACGTDNLLSGRMPSGRQDTHGDFRLVTDGKAAPEGAQWDAPGTGVFLDTPAGSITYDLGIVR